MRPTTRILPLLLLLISPVFAALADEPAKFEIRDGDRVVFLGDTLLERENTYGFLETRLVEQFADRHFTVRNLSWSGDTPHGVSRAMFDPPEKGWERLKEALATEKPMVVFLGYGMASSLQEIADRSGDITMNPDPTRYGRQPMSAARFRKELAELMDAIQETAKGNGAAGVRIVLLSPIRHEDLRRTRPGLPDPAAHNALLDTYSKEIESLAKERNATFVSLARLISGQPLPKGAYPQTSNGIHLNESGYSALASAVSQGLGWWPRSDVLPANTAKDPLRLAVMRKNQLFFHRFRPENWTYLLGFRKHEQGQNAVEIPKFDPLIAKEEQEIDRLKKMPLPARFAEAARTKAAAKAQIEAPETPKELPKFDVEKGFDIELWATNPLLEKPIEMNWDSDGRLWISSSNTYPQVNPEDVAASLAADLSKAEKNNPATGNDKILIIEDPGHTGKATKSTVFADGLLIPTCVAPFKDSDGKWGCYVGASTELIALVDTTGSGHADSRQIILSGLGTEDTHQNVHTLRWAPDGRLYFDQSIYIHSHFETPWGMVRLNSGGVVSWDPRTERVEVHYKGFCNPWGHAWDEWGQEFVTDGAGFEGVSWGVPEAQYFTYENGRKLIPSISPGTYPKFISLELVRSPLFPADWQGSFITNDFRAHRIVHFGLNDLSENSDPAAIQSGYVTKELPDLVRTGDLSFRPVDLKQGPDGALYVADWSNPVINHGEVDFRDPRRDHYSGRIWRISAKGKAPVSWKKLTDAPALELTQLLDSKNAWEKEQARYVLVSVGVLRPTFFAGATVQPDSFAPNPDPKYRAMSARLLGAINRIPYAFGGTLPSTGANRLTLAALAADSSPRVRVEAMRSLARTPTAQNAALALDAATKAPANDPFYEYAAWLTINDLAEPWIKAVTSGEWKIEGHEKQLEYALGAIDPALATDVLSKVLANRQIPRDGGPWIALISKAGRAAELRKLLEAVSNQQLDSAAAEQAVDALREAARVRNARPDGDLTKIEALLTAPNGKVAAGAAHLVGAWKLPNAAETLNELASGKAPAELRLAAIQGLREVGGEKALADLHALTKPEQAAEFRRAALVALTQIKLSEGVAASGDVLSAVSDDKAALETWRALFQIKGAPDAFAKALPQNLPQPILAAGLRAARELGRNGAGLEKVFAALTGAKPETAAASQNYSGIVELVKRDGDPARGETIFRRPQLTCLVCHAIGGAGGKVGPELTSLGASAPLDYIIESVLVPNAKVKEGYNAVSFTLKDGTVAAGIQTRETPQEIFLRNAAGQETSVPKANIVSRENIGSIMPAGLAEQLQERERLDLYAFLSQLGKPGPYDASKGNVARYWALVPSASAPVGQLDPAYSGPLAAGYTLVDGRLPKDLLQSALQFLPGAGDAMTAVSKFEWPAAGQAKMDLEGATEAWIDGKPASKNADGHFAVDLASGEHTISVRLNVKQLPEVLRAECTDAKFLGN